MTIFILSPPAIISNLFVEFLALLQLAAWPLLWSQPEPLVCSSRLFYLTGEALNYNEGWITPSFMVSHLCLEEIFLLMCLDGLHNITNNY